MPRSFGDTAIHSSHIDWAVKYDCPLPCVASTPPNEIEQEIGKIIAQRLIDDGATLQLGIGNIPDAILCSLGNHKDLGVHTEILGDTMVDLAERGNISNKMKIKHRGRTVSSLAIGTKRVYDFLHNNPFVGVYTRHFFKLLIYTNFLILQITKYLCVYVEMLAINYVNDPRVILQQPKMTAINSCIEMDITGQICSDSLGCKMYSGFGGQLDFTRGAALGQDGRGKAIIAFPSVTSKGESKIQPVIKLGMKTNFISTIYKKQSFIWIKMNNIIVCKYKRVISSSCKYDRNLFHRRWYRGNESTCTLHSY